MSFVPEERRQPWLDAWNIRTMVSFALKRQRDSQKRGQKPRDSRLTIGMILMIVKFTVDVGIYRLTYNQT